MKGASAEGRGRSLDGEFESFSRKIVMNAESAHSDKGGRAKDVSRAIGDLKNGPSSIRRFPVNGSQKRAAGDNRVRVHGANSEGVVGDLREGRVNSNSFRDGGVNKGRGGVVVDQERSWGRDVSGGCG